MDLARYIENLLLVYDCVIIPGFGGIVGNYSPAYINHNKNTIYPPYKKLYFNRSLSFNDGLLASYISYCEKISYSKATDLLREQVAMLKNQIKHQQKVSFGKLGDFLVENNGQISFVASPTTNLLIESYGFQPVKLPAVSQHSGLSDFDYSIKHQSVMNQKTKRIVTGILIGVPLVALLIYLPLKTNIFNSPEINYTALNPVNVAETLTVVPADTTTSVQQTTKPFASTDKKKALLYTENQSGQKLFYLIAGSFKSRVNAEKYKSEMVVKGYEAFILREHDSLFRIALYASDNRDEALLQLQKLRQELGNQSIWMLSR